MKKVLLINAIANSGSTGRIAEGIGIAAKARGWQSYMAFARGTHHSDLELIKVGNKLDMYEHALVSRFFDNQGLMSKNTTKKFIGEIEKLAPDIIHLHNIHGYYLNYLVFFSFLRQVQVPIVWTLHDCWPFTGHCVHFTKNKCYKWLHGCYDCPLRNEYPSSLWLDKSKRNYELKKDVFTSLDNLTIVAVSDWLASVTKLSFLSKYPILRIYNGLDLNTFCPPTRCIAKDKYRLIAVATDWEDAKGPEQYFALRALLPKEKYEILMVGMPPKKRKKIPDGIIAMGRTSSQQELVGLYQSSDVVLNLSSQETFGMTTAEGFACGVPGIAYDNTALPELFADKSCGICVQTGNIKAVAKAVETIVTNRSIYTPVACRAYAERMYDRVSRYNDYIDLYERLLR